MEAFRNDRQKAEGAYERQDQQQCMHQVRFLLHRFWYFECPTICPDKFTVAPSLYSFFTLSDLQLNLPGWLLARTLPTSAKSFAGGALMTQATEMIETKEGLGGNGRKVQAQRKRRRRKGKRASRRRNGVVTGTWGQTLNTI